MISEFSSTRALTRSSIRSQLVVDPELGLCARLEGPRDELSTVYDQAFDRLLRVFHIETRPIDLDASTIAHLTPLLRVKRSGAGDDLARVPHLK